VDLGEAATWKALDETRKQVNKLCDEAQKQFEAKQWPQAVESYSKAIQLEPANWESWFRRGRAHVELARWDQALADEAKAIELGGFEPELWYQHALLCLHVGDTNGYRAAAARILKRLSHSGNPSGDLSLMLWVSVLAPSAVADPGSAVSVAEMGPSDHDGLLSRGAALYRAGRLKEAARRLAEAEPMPEGNTSRVYTWLFLAMTHYRLGHAEEARRWLSKAVQEIDNPSGESRPWNRKLTLQLLRREAEALLSGNQPPPPKDK
jgi:tetratricopeptide (TPR) repeat protein